MVDDFMAGETTQSDEFVVVYMAQEQPFTNWSAHRITIWGQQFPTVEHAFQYKKFCETDPVWVGMIHNAKSPWEAKKLAWSKPVNQVWWDALRENIMKELIAEKINQHTDVRRALRSTGNLAILEKDDVKESFWGIGNNSSGQNRLGKIWMALRETVR